MVERQLNQSRKQSQGPNQGRGLNQEASATDLDRVLDQDHDAVAVTAVNVVIPHLPDPVHTQDRDHVRTVAPVHMAAVIVADTVATNDPTHAAAHHRPITDVKTQAHVVSWEFLV